MPPSQVPPRQRAQAQGSVTAQVIGVDVQVCATQASIVQAWPSSQSPSDWQHWVSSGPGAQPPATQASGPVHASPSSQAAPFSGVWAHPSPPVMQVSLVQGFWSSQLCPCPAQVPAVHASSWVQGLPSSQGRSSSGT